jgi:hypothetical protein
MHRLRASLIPTRDSMSLAYLKHARMFEPFFELLATNVGIRRPRRFGVYVNLTPRDLWNIKEIAIQAGWFPMAARPHYWHVPSLILFF